MQGWACAGLGPQYRYPLMVVVLYTGRTGFGAGFFASGSFRTGGAFGFGFGFGCSFGFGVRTSADSPTGCAVRGIDAVFGASDDGPGSGSRPRGAPSLSRSTPASRLRSALAASYAATPPKPTAAASTPTAILIRTSFTIPPTPRTTATHRR